MIFVYMILASIIGAGITGTVGYYKGYTQCTNAAQIAILEAENERLKLEQEYYKKAKETAEQIAAETAQVELQNQETIRVLRQEISKPAPSNKCVLDRNFLQSVNNIR